MKLSYSALVFSLSALATAAPLTTRNLQYTGTITYYSQGLGSCGYNSQDSDAVVALSSEMMNSASGSGTQNPNCGRTISIYNPSTGVTAQGTVVDTCVACGYTDLDLSPSLFDTLASPGEGRVSGVQWGFN